LPSALLLDFAQDDSSWYRFGHDWFPAMLIFLEFRQSETSDGAQILHPLVLQSTIAAFAGKENSKTAIKINVFHMLCPF
jgi:hypothetical protein